MLVLGAVCLTLALLAGFAAREPSRPHITHVVAPARGSLIEVAEHPEWKQFLVQAAFRRADELDRLRMLPETPVVIVDAPAAPEPAPAETPEPAPADDPVAQTTENKVAALPLENDPEVKDEFTGAIEDKPNGVMTVEIGEASSAELPLAEPDVLPPVRQPETLPKQNDSERKVPGKRAKLKRKPPAKPAAQPAVTGLLPALFGDRASGQQ